MQSSWSPPPPSSVPSAYSADQQSSLSSLQNVNPSIVIIILILSITIFISVSLCLILRFLRRRRLNLHHRPDSHRVSPEIDAAATENVPSSVIDSLPLFTFSSITRRQSSTASGDCPVCLSKFEPNDQLRLLPLCCHAFHAECIDIWLQSNQTCPLCRSSIYASESDVIKALLESSAAASGGDSFRIEIGSISRRHQGESDTESHPPQHQHTGSYSIGSFDYIVDQESEIIVSQTHHRRNFSDKEDAGADPTPQPGLVADVGGGGRGWLKDYVDRLSASVSSRSLSFRSSGRFFTGSSRRTEIQATGEWDLEANRIGEEISEMFRWFSGV